MTIDMYCMLKKHHVGISSVAREGGGPAWPASFMRQHIYGTRAASLLATPLVGTEINEHTYSLVHLKM